MLTDPSFAFALSLLQLIPALIEHPLSELPAHVHFMPGVPVRPMLAKATTGVGEVLDKFSGIEFTCEYKYDGERVQVRGVVCLHSFFTLLCAAQCHTTGCFLLDCLSAGCQLILTANIS